MRFWHFPSVDGGDIDGINDAGLEAFEGDRERSVARECLQNSLDARQDDNNPVRVRFERFNVSSNNIPGRDELRNILYRAKEYASDQDNASELYSGAINVLDEDSVSILKISDYNTTGLRGDDEDSRFGWYRLVRAMGVSSMTGDGGGSFGIGKGAPFVASALRTVFYSTLNIDGEVAFQGKSRISSFRDGSGDIRRGVGQYGEKVEDRKGVSSIRNADAIPTLFQRSQIGTDIFIVGYKATDSSWAESLLRSVLDSFWAAVHDGILEVEIIDDGHLLHKVNKDTLGTLIDEFASADEYTKLFYLSMIEPTRKFEDDIPSLGRVEFYVRVGEGPRHIQGMRRSLMRIHSFSRLRVMSEDFVGVFIARGKEGNDKLRRLEPPAHDQWDSNRGETIHREALKATRAWIITSLRELAGERTSNPEEIPDLSRYLPEDIERDDLDSTASSTGNESSEDSDKETADETSTEGSSGPSEQPPAVVNTAIIKPAITKPNEGQKRGEGGGGGSGGSGGGAGDPNGNTHHIDTVDLYVRPRESRIGGKRVYIFTIVPKKDDSGTVNIVAEGDDGRYGIDVVGAVDELGNSYEVQGSQIRGLGLVAGRKMELTIELASNRRYALGIE